VNAQDTCFGLKLKTKTFGRFLSWLILDRLWKLVHTQNVGNYNVINSSFISLSQCLFVPKVHYNNGIIDATFQVLHLDKNSARIGKLVNGTFIQNSVKFEVVNSICLLFNKP